MSDYFDYYFRVLRGSYFSASQSQFGKPDIIVASPAVTLTSAGAGLCYMIN